jgi:hypothetical protein
MERSKSYFPFLPILTFSSFYRPVSCGSACSVFTAVLSVCGPSGLPVGTPTKRQVSKRQVSKRLVSKRPVSKRQVYKTSGLQNVRFLNVWFQNVQIFNLIYLLNKKYRKYQVSIPVYSKECVIFLITSDYGKTTL